MGMREDFINFVDGGSPVPYYVDNATYAYKPSIVHDVFEHDFKIFYKSYGKYYVGVGFSQFVRPIHAKDFKTMKQIKESSTYKDNTNKCQQLKQLVFDL